MTPKEKAEELVKTFTNVENVSIEIISKGRYSEYYPLNIKEAKQCALIAVEYMLEESVYVLDGYYDRNSYWKEVKQEVEQL